MIADLALHPAPTSHFLPAIGGVQASPPADWFAVILDQIDYGIAAVDGDGELLHVNWAALHVLQGRHPLRIDGRQVRARRSEDQAHVERAIAGASARGLRSLLTLGDDDASASVAVIPIPAFGFCAGAPARSAALLVVSRQAVCEELSAQSFARGHGLTPAEAQVLRLLCGGAQPNEIATLQGVAVSTIRTQIVSIRAKTGARNIGALLRQVAALPPLVSALRHAGAEALALN